MAAVAAVAAVAALAALALMLGILSGQASAAATTAPTGAAPGRAPGTPTLAPPSTFNNGLPLFADPGPTDRVLVVAPHPDDETLCCAGLLQRARAKGAAVAVVWITSGDSFELDAMLVSRSLWPNAEDFRRLGEQRVSEARTAAEQLGVERRSQYFLGYPDRGIVPMLGEYYSRTYTSPYTGLSAVADPGAQSPEASYQGQNLERDLALVLDQFQPTIVLAAAPQDQHPDHSASGALVRKLLVQRGKLSTLRYWIVHSPQWPRPEGYHPDLTLLPPPGVKLPWQMLLLSDDEETRKMQALRDHHSQDGLEGIYLRSFVRANELFAPAQ